MDTLSINVTLAYFYNNTNFIGSLNITSGIITYTIGEESVTFNPDETSGNKQLLYLLCADESKITLYNGCSVVEDVSNDHDFVPGNISLQVLKDIKNPFKVIKVLLCWRYIHIHACILSASICSALYCLDCSCAQL